MNNNSNANFENVAKLTKYQVRLASTTDPAKQNVYKNKIQEYSNKLNKGGFNSNEIINAIQTGGDVKDIFNNQVADIKKNIDRLRQNDGVKINDQVDEIIENVKGAKNKFNTIEQNMRTLGNLYKDFAKDVLTENDNINHSLQDIIINPGLDGAKLGELKKNADALKDFDPDATYNIIDEMIQKIKSPSPLDAAPQVPTNDPK